MERVPRELFVPEATRERLRRRAGAAAVRADDLPALHGRADLRGARARGGRDACSTSGTGSGYAAAVLAELAADVHTIERHPRAGRLAARPPSLAAGYERVSVHVGDGSVGLDEEAPFDAIAVAAAAPEVPPALWAQLREGGHIAMPLETGRRGAAPVRARAHPARAAAPGVRPRPLRPLVHGDR